MASRLGCLWFASLLAACGEAPLEPREPTPGVAHYRFASYNVHFPEAGNRRTLDVIGETGADLLCLQEVNAEWQRSLVERFELDYPYRLFHPLEGPDGLAVISRYPLDDYGVYEVPEGWHPAWHVLVQTPAGPIQVLNVHLRAIFDGGEGNPFTSYVETQSDHRYQLASYEQHLLTGIPNVILGDFNEGVDGDAIESLEDQGYRNALPLYHPGQPTWRGRSVGGQLEMTIDHVLFDRAFEPLNAYVLSRGGSDHLPVVAHLEAAYDWAAGSTSQN
jgi:endonuclease/exonuclease/phosphatase family metal-dependent hydrolase